MEDGHMIHQYVYRRVSEEYAFVSNLYTEKFIYSKSLSKADYI